MARTTIRLEGTLLDAVRRCNAAEADLRARLDAAGPDVDEALVAEWEQAFDEAHASMWQEIVAATGVDTDDGACWGIDDSFLEENGVAFLTRCDCPEQYEGTDDEGRCDGEEGDGEETAAALDRGTDGPAVPRRMVH